VDIEVIREKVRNGNYLVKSHAITHAVKEGFDRRNMFEAVINGSIIETYLDARRLLICGRTTLSENLDVYLHVVCEYSDPDYVEFVTAYLPDELEWESPPFVRRRKKK
jgi:hypothetical protein